MWNILTKDGIYIYIYIYVHYQSNVFVHPQTSLFFTLKVLLLTKQLKHQHDFIHRTKDKYSRVTLNTI